MHGAGLIDNNQKSCKIKNISRIRGQTIKAILGDSITSNPWTRMSAVFISASFRALLELVVKQHLQYNIHEPIS